MRLEILAISDSHLGEPTSLLSFPHGRHRLWEALREHFGEPKQAGDDYNRRFAVDEMILVGDIPDSTLSSTSEIITHTNALIQTLGSAADIAKGVYLPGNHDHTLWTDYRKRRYGECNEYGVTTPAGDLLVEESEPCDEGDWATELLTIFFGYPSGSSWRAIQKDKEARDRKFSFVVANPIYATRPDERTYVFAHGTHFRKYDVAQPKIVKRIVDYLQLDRMLGHVEIESDCDVTEATSFEHLEQIVAPFVDSLWPEAGNIPTSRADEVWYVYTTLSGKFGRKRPSPEESARFAWQELPEVPESRIRRLTGPDGKPQDDSVSLWEQHFLGHMLRHLSDHNVGHDKLTFVYGDTHRGGWGRLARDSGEPIHIYNCGGWSVDDRDDHPACHVFAVDEGGTEYLLDVSFADVTVGGEALLKVAADDVEHRVSSTRWLVRALLNLVARR